MCYRIASVFTRHDVLKHFLTWNSGNSIDGSWKCPIHGIMVIFAALKTIDTTKDLHIVLQRDQEGIHLGKVTWKLESTIGIAGLQVEHADFWLAG